MTEAWRRDVATQPRGVEGFKVFVGCKSLKSKANTCALSNADGPEMGRSERR